MIINKDELIKCKDDVVYFAEHYLDLSLETWQRDLLQKYNDGAMIFHKNHSNKVTKILFEHRKLLNAK